MDAYLKYINDLVARGFSFEQIREQLVKQNVPTDSLQQLLDYAKNAVDAAPKNSQAAENVAGDPTVPRLKEVYSEYVKILKGRGISDNDVINDLQSRGVDAPTIASLLPTVVPQTQNPQVQPASDQNQPASEPELKTEPIFEDSNSEVADNDSEPGANKPAADDTTIDNPVSEPTTFAQESETINEDAAGHLESVAAHISEVADRLADIEAQETSQNPNTPFTASQSETSGSTEHLLAAGDHLAEVADKLQTTEYNLIASKQPPGDRADAPLMTAVPIPESRPVAAKVSLPNQIIQTAKNYLKIFQYKLLELKDSVVSNVKKLVRKTPNERSDSGK